MNVIFEESKESANWKMNKTQIDKQEMIWQRLYHFFNDIEFACIFYRNAFTSLIALFNHSKKELNAGNRVMKINK